MAKQTTKQRKAAPKPASSKLDKIALALRAPKGATIAQLAALTGWQPHSVWGAMSGNLKKQCGLSIISTKSGNERVYKIGGAR
ncbi:MAG: DUF3489 domain-containing protein [Hyphomonadaceae bacterium]|nr:DUF3489 domain-containing protein [Hyphomonadaceae bacterium]